MSDLDKIQTALALDQTSLSESNCVISEGAGLVAECRRWFGSFSSRSPIHELGEAEP